MSKRSVREMHKGFIFEKYNIILNNNNKKNYEYQRRKDLCSRHRPQNETIGHEMQQMAQRTVSGVIKWQIKCDSALKRSTAGC